jgi:hypothetical protein
VANEEDSGTAETEPKTSTSSSKRVAELPVAPLVPILIDTVVPAATLVSPVKVTLLSPTPEKPDVVFTAALSID